MTAFFSSKGLKPGPAVAKKADIALNFAAVHPVSYKYMKIFLSLSTNKKQTIHLILKFYHAQTT